MTDDEPGPPATTPAARPPSTAELTQRVLTAVGVTPTRAVLRLLRGLFRVTLMASDSMLERHRLIGRQLRDDEREAHRRDRVLEMQQRESELLLELLKSSDAPLEDLRNLDELSRRLNTTRVLTRALERAGHMPDDDGNGQGGNGQTGDGRPEMSDTWLDRFLQFAATRNEPWREEMLAACLAREAARPGSVSLRALWSLAMLEAEEFADLRDFVDNAAKLYRDGRPLGFFMVGYYAQLIKSDYVRPDGAPASVSDLFDRLEAVGLFAIGHGDVDLMKASSYELEMGPVRYAVSVADNPPRDLADAFLDAQNAPAFGRDGDNSGSGRYSLHAMPLTRTGNEIAALLDWSPSAEAIRRFEEALRQQADNLRARGLGH